MSKFQLYYGKNKLYFDDDIHFVLDQHAKFNLYVIYLTGNNTPRVDMSLHLDTLTRFRANQSLILLLNAVDRKAANTNLIVLGLTRSRHELTIYRTLG